MTPKNTKPVRRFTNRLKEEAERKKQKKDSAGLNRVIEALEKNTTPLSERVKSSKRNAGGNSKILDIMF